MTEPLTTALVTTELQKLLAAFPRNLGKSNPAMMADVYKGGLRGIDGEAFREAVDVCIQNDSYFPKVARLREAAHEWTKRNRHRFETVNRAAWNLCGVCGAKAERRMITRPVLTKPDTDPRTWHYRLADGRKIRRGDLVTMALVAALLPLETVESSSLYIDHLPGPHHVRGESWEDEP